MRNYYDILGVTPKAPVEIIAAVYKAWMHALKIHPDLGGDEELAKEINIAYETLKDPDRRAKYDSKITIKEPSKFEESQRRAPRVPVDSKIAFCIPPDGRWIPAQTVNASCMGLKILTVENLYSGSHVAIAFPGFAGPAVEAQVRWVKTLNKNENWGFECGVEFFSPLPDVLKRLGSENQPRK